MLDKYSYFFCFAVIFVLMSGCASKQLDNPPVEEPIVLLPVEEKNTTTPIVVEKSAVVPVKKVKPKTAKTFGDKSTASTKVAKPTPRATALSKKHLTLREIGPHGWTVGDIIKKIKYQKMGDAEIVRHINTAKLPYKKFNYEEINILLGEGISYKILNAMIKISK